MRPDPGRAVKRDEDGVVAPSRVVLVVIVLIAIAGATWIAGLAPDDSDAAATSSQVRATKTPSPTESSASASATPSPSAAAETRTPAPTTTKKPAAAPLKRGQVSVSVFNNSSRKGLAATTGAQATKAGWKVLGSDNWYGTIPASTVYFPASLKSSASMLAKDLGITRVKPAVKPMRNDRLTVIVTSDYRG